MTRAPFVIQGKDPETPAITELIMQKIHRPALVWALWQGQRCPGAKRPLAPAATTNLEPFLGVDTTQFLLVQSVAFSLQENVQAAIAKAAAHAAISRKRTRMTTSSGRRWR